MRILPVTFNCNFVNFNSVLNKHKEQDESINISDWGGGYRYPVKVQNGKKPKKNKMTDENIKKEISKIRPDENDEEIIEKEVSKIRPNNRRYETAFNPYISTEWI